ncbi:MAG: RNA 2',3'-cyclic phosphodiesterase [Bacteriovoracaceae bacterium]|nr:RNA 2',3'-cyclic phosphodiesterase [Bacteriovoracaceae bacterium]
MGRYFIGIPLPLEVKKKLKVQSWPGLSRYKDEKLVPQNNWHITLAFIGQLDEEKLEELKSLLQVFTWGDAFKVGIRNFGAFPSFEEGRVLWMGCEKGHDSVTVLANKIRRQLDDLEISYDSKPFVPHITLARLRSPKNLSRLADNGKMKQEVTFNAEEIVLFDSEKEKTPYAVVERIALNSL